MSSHRGPSVAVLVPHGVEVPAAFALALRGLEVPEDAAFLGTNMRPLDAARNHLARRALELGATWTLWLDSDTVPPSDALRRLLALRVPFASGLYMIDADAGPKACAYARGENGYHALAGPFDGGSVELDGVGFGCALVHADILRRTPEPWFKWTYGTATERGVGEDFFFCERVREATGVRPVVDLGLHVGHVKTRTLWPSKGDRGAAATVASGGVAGGV